MRPAGPAPTMPTCVRMTRRIASYNPVWCACVIVRSDSAQMVSLSEAVAELVRDGDASRWRASPT